MPCGGLLVFYPLGHPTPYASVENTVLHSSLEYCVFDAVARIFLPNQDMFSKVLISIAYGVGSPKG
jgi:hypothetical protein